MWCSNNFFISAYRRQSCKSGPGHKTSKVTEATARQKGELLPSASEALGPRCYARKTTAPPAARRPRSYLIKIATRPIGRRLPRLRTPAVSYWTTRTLNLSASTSTVSTLKSRESHRLEIPAEELEPADTLYIFNAPRDSEYYIIYPVQIRTGSF